MKKSKKLASKLKDENFDISLKSDHMYSSIYTFLSQKGEDIQDEFQECHDLTENQMESVRHDLGCHIGEEWYDIIEFPKFLSDADEIRTLLKRANDDPYKVFWVEGADAAGGTNIRVLTFEIVEGK